MHIHHIHTISCISWLAKKGFYFCSFQWLVHTELLTNNLLVHYQQCCFFAETLRVTITKSTGFLSSRFVTFCAELMQTWRWRVWEGPRPNKHPSGSWVGSRMCDVEEGEQTHGRTAPLPTAGCCPRVWPHPSALLSNTAWSYKCSHHNPPWCTDMGVTVYPACHASAIETSYFQEEKKNILGLWPLIKHTRFIFSLSVVACNEPLLTLVG